MGSESSQKTNVPWSDADTVIEPEALPEMVIPEEADANNDPAFTDNVSEVSVAPSSPLNPRPVKLLLRSSETLIKDIYNPFYINMIQKKHINFNNHLYAEMQKRVFTIVNISKQDTTP